MSSNADRPHKGISLLDAFAKWSDPAEYQVLVEIAGTEELPTINEIHLVAQKERQNEYQQHRAKLERDFQDLLISGEKVLASAVSPGFPHREIMDPSLWEFLELDFYLLDAGWEGSTYECLEFFEPSAIPTNVRIIPEWASPPPKVAARSVADGNVFEPDATYEHIHISHNFTLGPVCSKVVKLLDEASRTNSPWVAGKTLLAEAGSKQLKMTDVFEAVVGWDLLIESDGRGQYRLRHRRPR